MWPDFEGGSIVNLMQDIVRARGGHSSLPGLAGVEVRGWQDARTVVLLVLDGVGLRQIEGLHESAFLRRHVARGLTSVFPSTTATAITTFMTARPPVAHGLTGWHVRCGEPGLDGRVLAILPVTQRGGGSLGMEAEEALALTCRAPSLFSALPAVSQVVSPSEIAHSPFSRRHSEGALRTGYDGLDGLFAALDAALDATAPPDYLYAYWPDFDHCAHIRGCASEQALGLLHAMDAALEAWAGRRQGDPVHLLITADHGFIDAPADRLLELERYPALADCLASPLSGERRAVFCHVKAGRERDFERALGELSEACVPWRSADLLAAGRFGPGEPHPRLRERIGDWTLEMKADWTLRDTVPGERAFRLVGVHGGTSEAEMRVPLVSCVLG